MGKRSWLIVGLLLVVVGGSLSSGAQEAKAWPGECLYLQARIAETMFAQQRLIGRKTRLLLEQLQVSRDISRLLSSGGGTYRTGADAERLAGLRTRLEELRSEIDRLDPSSLQEDVRRFRERRRELGCDDPPAGPGSCPQGSTGSVWPRMPDSMSRSIRNLVPATIGTGTLIYFMRAVGAAALQRAGGFIFITQDAWDRHFGTGTSGDEASNYELIGSCRIGEPLGTPPSACVSPSASASAVAFAASSCPRRPRTSRVACPLKDTQPYRLSSEPSDSEIREHPCYKCPPSVLRMSFDEWQEWPSHDLDAKYFRGKLFPTCLKEANSGRLPGHWNADEHRWEEEPTTNTPT